MSRIVLASLALACASSARGQGFSFPPPLELRVPKPPTVAIGENGPFLTYEVHVTSFIRQPIRLKKLEVFDARADHRLLLSLDDSLLTRAVERPGMPPSEAVDRLRVSGGTRAVIFVWVPLTTGPAPTTVRHRLTIEQGAGDSVRTQSLDASAVPVTPEAVAIGPPLRGGVWLTGNGPSNESGHRRELVPLEGTTRIPQRFAIDFVRLGDDNRTYSGDPLRNETHYAEGSDAIAVGDGTVVALKDGIPENVPGIMSRAVLITLETVGGNHVIIDLGGGYYAFYAHLEPGSLRVKLGDRVKRGQVIGLVGNSGNSTEPHLHFHVSDANSPLGSESVPYRIDSFEIVGHCTTFNMGCQRSAPVTRKGEQPLANTLVRFP